VATRVMAAPARFPSAPRGTAHGPFVVPPRVAEELAGAGGIEGTDFVVSPQVPRRPAEVWPSTVARMSRPLTLRGAM